MNKYAKGVPHISNAENEGREIASILFRNSLVL
jgi:hypothetical protein